MERSTQGAEAGAWILSDGRAGNQRQARALAAAMAVDAREWLLEPRAPWRWLAPRMFPGSRAAFGDRFGWTEERPLNVSARLGGDALRVIGLDVTVAGAHHGDAPRPP